MKKRIVAAMLAVMLLCCCVPAQAAGGADDPLVSKSYVDETGDALVASEAQSLGTRLAALFEKLFKGGDLAPEGVPLTTCKYRAGGSMTLYQGSTFSLLSGSAEMTIADGTVVDVTLGTPVGSGKLAAYHRYLGCEDADAALTITPGSVISYEGLVDYVEGCPFDDVYDYAWYFNDVFSAYKRQLVNGLSEHIYAPEEPLTLAQAIKLAACMHQLYYDGAVTLQNGSGAWYQTYLDYCIREKLLDTQYGEKAANELNAPVTRAEFVHVFYHALDKAAYKQINSAVLSGAIPDVAYQDTYGSEIYTFYRAGILTGDVATETTPEGLFRPDDQIRRSEVATIMNRMFDETARKHFSLTGTQ